MQLRTDLDTLRVQDASTEDPADVKGWNLQPASGVLAVENRRT